jgi:long-chain acyl-CoA synthetase
VTDPLSLLPLALAAHGGRVDEFETQQLVAAGLNLLRRSASLVRALDGKRAAVLLPTSPQFFVALAAAEGRGAVLVNPLAAPAEIAFQIGDANVGAVFTVGALVDRVPNTVVRVLLDDAPRTARVLVDSASREIDLGTHTGFTLEGDPDSPGSDDEAAIVYTSAMAGRPLGAVLTHRNLLANARATITAGANTADERTLCVLPLAHLFGFVVSAGAPLLVGATVVTMPRFNPARAAELVASRGITEIVGVPAVFAALLAAFAKNRTPAETLRLCICGGARLDPTVQDRWFAATGVELRQGYGLTEAGPVCLFNRVDRPNVRGTLGVPFPGVDVELRRAIPYDDDGRPMSGVDRTTTNDGEICVRGENVFRGYVAHGELGLPVVDGWLHTGDLGHRNADGTIVFTGLVKPMFTRNGFNIYPREIERTIGTMPGIERVHVRAVPAPARENDIAVVVHGDVDTSDVKRWCEARLSAYKQPSVIEIVGRPE